ncbi:hypothetical protein BGZ73_005179 [Actinomortierella ambigua]|nr:hypothetical protein BGZ73_005179 [Actinomortierella ambigua]
MKPLFAVASTLLAFVGLAVSAANFAPLISDDDYVQRRLRNEPEFASLFTNASFVRDPEYQKNMADLKKMVVELNGGNSRSNSVDNAVAPSHKGHGKHYCVGAAYNPYRTIIFEDLMECNRQGWTTLVSFCIPKNIPTTLKSNSLQRVEGCIGTASNPYRAMYFRDEKNCNRNGWTHDFQLPSIDLAGPSHFVSVWEAFDPHRMNIGAGGDDFTKSGWQYRNHIGAFTISYPATPSGLEAIKLNLPKAIAINKRSTDLFGMPPAISITLAALAHLALQRFDRPSVPRLDVSVLDRFHDFPEVRAVARDLFNRGVAIELVRADTRPDSGMNLVTLHLMADGRRVAVLALYEGYNYGAGRIREALNTSIMQRVPVVLMFGRDIMSGQHHIMMYPGEALPVDLGIKDEL